MSLFITSAMDTSGAPTPTFREPSAPTPRLDANSDADADLDPYANFPVLPYHSVVTPDHRVVESITVMFDEGLR